MLQKPAVFISSTADLRSARDLVGKVLHSMGYEPVWQDVDPFASPQHVGDTWKGCA